MLALLSIPLLLGLSLFIDTSGDGEDPDEPPLPEEEPSTTETPQTDLLTQSGGTLETAGDDTITCTETADDLDGGAGHDLIYARGGADTVAGGAGNDLIFMGSGDDTSDADAPADAMAGDDFICGGHGQDLVADLFGSNELRGNLGHDTLIAVDGLSEAGSYDLLSEIGTTDRLSGGFGADILFGDNGDIMTGGAGRDSFLAVDDMDIDMEEVRITDFNPAMDTLFVVQLDGQTSEDDLTYIPTEGGIRVLFEGRAVALLEGLGADALPDLQTSIVELSDLENIT